MRKQETQPSCGKFGSGSRGLGVRSAQHQTIVVDRPYCVSRCPKVDKRGTIYSDGFCYVWKKLPSEVVVSPGDFFKERREDQTSDKGRKFINGQECHYILLVSLYLYSTMRLVVLGRTGIASSI